MTITTESKVAISDDYAGLIYALHPEVLKDLDKEQGIHFYSMVFSEVKETATRLGIMRPIVKIISPGPIPVELKQFLETKYGLGMASDDILLGLLPSIYNKETDEQSKSKIDDICKNLLWEANQHIILNLAKKFEVNVEFTNGRLPKDIFDQFLLKLKDRGILACPVRIFNSTYRS